MALPRTTSGEREREQIGGGRGEKAGGKKGIERRDKGQILTSYKKGKRAMYRISQVELLNSTFETLGRNKVFHFSFWDD